MISIWLKKEEKGTGLAGHMVFIFWTHFPAKQRTYTCQSKMLLDWSFGGPINWRSSPLRAHAARAPVKLITHYFGLHNVKEKVSQFWRSSYSTGQNKQDTTLSSYPQTTFVFCCLIRVGILLGRANKKCIDRYTLRTGTCTYQYSTNYPVINLD